MVTWPIAPFPQAPLIAGYTETPPNNTLRSATDKGPGKSRRRTTANSRNLRWPFLLTEAQTQELDDFYETDIESGSISFTHTDPRTGASGTYKIKEPPPYTRAGLFYRTTLEIEKLP